MFGLGEFRSGHLHSGGAQLQGELRQSQCERDLVHHIAADVREVECVELRGKSLAADCAVHQVRIVRLGQEGGGDGDLTCEGPLLRPRVRVVSALLAQGGATLISLFLRENRAVQ